MLGARLAWTCGCLLALAGCSSKDSNDSGDDGAGNGPPTTMGDPLDVAHEGQYHLGPVDFAESQYHNACAPQGGYRRELRESVGLGGEFLAGVSNQFSQNGGVCDGCILIETAEGQSIVARVVTYGVEQDAGDIDVSPAVYEAIHQGEYPRSMSWRFARCPEAGTLKYEFQTGANVYWSSLWVRNPRVPLLKLEVKSKNHPDFITLERGTDGTLTDASGFGDGAFTLRLTGLGDQELTEELPGFTPGELVTSEQQFD